MNNTFVSKWNNNVQILVNGRYSNLSEEVKKSNNAGYNGSLFSRVKSARWSQERRNGLTRYDDFSVNDLADMIFEQHNTCPMCGYSFGDLFDKNYGFEICHVVTPEFGGHLTKSNLQLMHKNCNKVMFQDVFNCVE